MKKITVYHVTCTQGYMMSEQGWGWSLQPWGCNTEYYQGYDDGGQEYNLPENYNLGHTQDGQPAIFDPDDNYCDMVRHSSGRPQLCSGFGQGAPVLLLAGN